MSTPCSLSVLIPARNEAFLSRTIESILANMRGDTEIIAVCDGYWPQPPIVDHPKVTVLHFTEPVGQRAGTNNAAKLSRAEFIMKLDGHCAVDEGFDVKMIAPYRDGTLDRNTTSVPRMFNLHAFDWKCDKCGNQTYQGPQPTKCEKPDCDGKTFSQFIVWKPRLSRRSDHGRIDKNLMFKYWRACGKRDGYTDTITETMCHVGACWMMNRERFWELGGLDECHGSWGQMGVEVSLKTWLSGGRQICNRSTWYSHMFRTQRGFSWPYKITDAEVEKARCYSRDFWLKIPYGKTLPVWPHAVHNFEWLLERFRPVPEWHEEVEIPPPPPTPPVRSTTKRRRRRTCSRRAVPVEPPKEKKDVEFLVMALTPKSSRYWKKFVRELAKQGDDDAS